jgi:hypothetical protein
MEDFTLPNVGARFKKLVLYTHPSKEAHARAICKGLKKIKLKESNFSF